MIQELSVNSGEVEVCRGECILRASAIGSCVVVAALDPRSGVAGMAHVMLPGASRVTDPSRRTRYAEDAVEELLGKITALGADKASLHVCLVGGGNVLGDGHDSPGPETALSLGEIFAGARIRVAAAEIGGSERRRCSLNAALGLVSYTIGDSGERILWQASVAPSVRKDTNRRA